MDEILDTLYELRDGNSEVTAQAGLDKRMLSEAITDFEKGSMCMIKSKFPGRYRASRLFEEK